MIQHFFSKFLECFYSHFVVLSAQIQLVDERITKRVAIVEAIKAGDLNFAKEELSAFKPEVHCDLICVLSSVLWL